MACCAVRARAGTPAREAALRAAWILSLQAGAVALAPAARLRPELAIWADFLALLAAEETSDAACEAGRSDAWARLRTEVAGRLLRVSPRLSGRVWRAMDAEPVGPALHLAALLAGKVIAP